ncbi:DUF3105 domain-containing protein [Agromyces seonyuensis]|uniref:DUF3105 domain-containing protein n=1 Tax=Agromyces seonyuensis TaxID=2662446 RepID=UPI0030153B62
MPQQSASNQNPTVKQQRAAARDAKLAAYRKKEAARKRNKLIWIWTGSVAAVAVIALVVTTIVLTPKPASYAGGATPGEIEGVETFENTSEHVSGTVEYPQDPPAGGQHNQVWLNCGVYDVPVPNENAVHSMEHGAVWLTYDPAQVDEDDIAKLKSYLPLSFAVFSPYENMDTPIAVSAWNAQLKVDSADDPRISEFFEQYWRAATVPEPNAVCTGGVDETGSLS